MNKLTEFLKYGFELVRLHAWNDKDSGGKDLGKAPIESGWMETPSLTADSVSKWFESGKNVGVRLRPVDLVVDVDPRNFNGMDSRVELGKKLGIDWEAFPRVATPSGGSHYYMTLPVDVGKIKKGLTDFPGIDFKTVGGQVVAPGSKHPNGGIYEWDAFSPGFPSPSVPHTLLSIISKQERNTSDHGVIAEEHCAWALQQLDVTLFNANDPWFEVMCAVHEASGGNAEEEFVAWSLGDPLYANQEAMVRARWQSLRSGKKGNSGVGTLERILISVGVHQVPWRDDMARDEFSGVDRDEIPVVVPKDRQVALMEEISEEFFCVDESGTMRVFRHMEDEVLKRKVWTRYKRRDFLEMCEAVRMYPNIELPVGDKIKIIPAGQYWLQSWRKKKTYSGIVFAPEFSGDKTPDGRFNLWRGFAVQPKPGTWNLMKKMIREVLVRGDEESYRYVMCWMARAVQEPWTPGEVALVFKGMKGVGKSTLGRAFCRLFGAHGLQVFSPGMLTGRFNAHLRDLVALFADEAFWAGDKTGESILKGLVTESIIAYEGKGTNAEVGRNCVHLFVATNSDWAVPAGLIGERRFAVFQTIDEVWPQSFWSELHAEMNNGGYEAMLQELSEMDLSDFNVRQVPRTNALLDQQLETANPFESWLIEFISSPDWLGLKPVEWSQSIPVGFTAFIAEDVLFAVEQAYKRSGLRGGVISPRHLGHRLKKYIPGVHRSRITRPEERMDLNTDRPYVYAFPDKQTMKQHVQKLVGADPFGDDSEDYL